MDIAYKNSVYQEEPKNSMLEILLALLNQKIENDPTFFRKKDRWAVLDSFGKKKYYPDYLRD